ncbi:MAG: exodeoxyribonuclease V subunit gamma [Spirochaetota bacterium]
MPFRYFHSERLGPLFPVLHDAVRRERQTLPPQKTQAIIVGNLETEAWITRRFLAVDGILMGVSFPFLESAIRSFCERLALQVTPAQSESFFLPPAGERPRALGLAELEVLVLGIISDKNNKELVQELGYENDQLNPSQITTLATVLAEELRETILHRPALLHEAGKSKQGRSAGEKLWYAVYTALKTTGRPFPTFEPGLADEIVAQNFPPGSTTETLHLFGMPMLSEYHLRVLAAIARHVSVNLYMTDLSDFAESKNNLLAAAGKKARVFVARLREVCESYATPFTATAVAAESESGKTFALYALPGLWRGAELMGDEFHHRLRHDSQLYQDDIGVSLTNPGLQYAAFERSLAMRQLVAFSRERFYEVSHPLAELWQIVADAVQRGLSRPLIVRYALHPLLAEKTAAAPELVRQWLRAIEKAHGYRDDYPETQAVFSLESALRRLDRGLLISNTQDSALPAARNLRPLDSADFAAGLHDFLKPLAGARARLSVLTGGKLADAMLSLQHEISGAGESTQALAQWFDQVRMLPGFDGLTLPHMVRLLKRQLPGKSLAQQTGREGITFSSLAASCYTRDTQFLFDLSEDADRKEAQAEYLFPELQTAPTRLTGFEQLANQLATALSSDARHVILAHSAQDPASGAEKYPSQALADAREAAEMLGRTGLVRQDFPATLLHGDPALPPVASDADRRTAWLLQNPAAVATPLATYTLPAPDAAAPAAVVEIRDLLAYLQNPARQLLRRHLPPDLEIAAFGRDEPKLAVGNDARLRFCEEYLEHALRDASNSVIQAAGAYISFRQERGDYAPEGFDQASRLLSENEGDRRLTTLAQKLRADFRLVEYIFHAEITMAFVVEETPRLTRLYYPAVCVRETTLTGSSGILLQDPEGRLFRLMSAIYGERNANLVELHLLLCLFALAKINLVGNAIALADFATNTRSKDPIGAIEFTPRTGLSLPDTRSAHAYLEQLLSALSAQQVAWYDHSLVKEPKLAEWSDLSPDEILLRFAKQPEKNTKAELKRLQQYFALEADGGTVGFFDAFIRPVAILDRRENPAKPPASQKAAKAGTKKAGKR